MLQNEIDKFSWYQTVNFWDGIKSRGIPYCGDPAWGNILTFLPENLNNKRILDLGCNAGIFCIRSILMGARECVGVDSNNWKKDDYLGQARLVKDLFEEKYDREFNIEYIESRMKEYLIKEIGIFDYCFAIASLYYAKDSELVVRRISETCKNVIVRLRDADRIQKFTNLFEINGYTLCESMREEWDKKLGIPANDFYLYHYVKTIL